MQSTAFHCEMNSPGHDDHSQDEVPPAHFGASADELMMDRQVVHRTSAPCLFLKKLRNLLGPLAAMQVPNTILDVKLDVNLASQASSTAIQGARLDARHVRHHLELRVQARTTVATEEVLVDFARGAHRIPCFGGSLCYAE